MDECVLGHNFTKFHPEFSPETLELGETVTIANITTETFRGRDMQVFTVNRCNNTTLQLGSRHFKEVNFRDWAKPLKVVEIIKTDKLNCPRAILTYKFKAVD